MTPLIHEAATIDGRSMKIRNFQRRRSWEAMANTAAGLCGGDDQGRSVPAHDGAKPISISRVWNARIHVASPRGPGCRLRRSPAARVFTLRASIPDARAVARSGGAICCVARGLIAIESESAD